MKNMYHFTDGGLRNIWLANGFKLEKGPYGKVVTIEDQAGLTMAICKALAMKPAHLTGAEFRYIRQSMLLSQKSLGIQFGVTEQAVAKWEKTGKLPKYADSLIRVFFIAHSDGHEKVRNLVNAMNHTEQVIHLIMKETSKGWSYSEEVKVKKRSLEKTS